MRSQIAQSRLGLGSIAVRAMCLAFLLAVSACSSTDDNNDTPLEVEFSDLRIEELTAIRAVARFDTSIPTSCEVEYGLDAADLNLSAVDPDMEEGELNTAHQVPLEDLEPGTTYYWRGFVEVEGESFWSEIQEFTTESDDNANPGPIMTNFALGAEIVSVSSNFGGGENDSTWGVSNALDGMMSTEWATQGDGDAASFTFDMGEPRALTHVAFRSRKMTDGSSIIEQFELSFEGGEVVGPFDAPDPDQRYEFELSTPVTAQQVTVRATQTTGGNTGIKEIEFLGAPE